MYIFKLLKKKKKEKMKLIYFIGYFLSVILKNGSMINKLFK